MKYFKEYIVFHKKGNPPPQDIEKVRSTSEVVILDAETPRALHIEASEDAINKIRKSLPGWIIAQMRTIQDLDNKLL